MALCDKSDVETTLQLTAGTITDALANVLIPGAQSAIERFVRRSLEAADRVSTLDGNGTIELLLPSWPINSVTSVVEDGVTLVEGTDFEVYTDRLIRVRSGRDRSWVRKRKAITVSYNGGYNPIPEALRDICVRIVARAYQAGAAFAATADAAGIRQETIDNYSVTYGSPAADVAASALVLTDYDRDQLVALGFRRRYGSTRL